MPAENQQRMAILDVVRGFAIVSILLLHNIEHFDFYFKPTWQPAWLNSIDKGIWDGLFFLFSGKSYAIFALLFGVTFYIQSSSRAKSGEPFAGRFAWRMILLLGFGMVNSAFYQGDILSIYAIIGLFIIPFEKSSSRTILLFAIVLMLQPFFWGKVIEALFTEGMVVKDPLSWTYFGLSTEYLANGNFAEVVAGNLGNGKKAVVLWTWENGRVFQTLALFLLGFLAGRTGLFKTSPENTYRWKRIFLVACISFALLYPLEKHLPNLVAYNALLEPLQTIVSSWANLGFMVVLVSLIVLLYQRGSLNRFFQFFAPLGKMSLTNYIMQSIIGSIIYYGFGLGLYQYTGATLCLAIGLTMAFAQQWFCRWWLKSHEKGLLEALWHRLTWGKTG